MESKLCMNCFAQLSAEDGGVCPVCGWDNSKAQVKNGLPYGTVLAGRYAVGRVKSANGEGMSYAALDSSTRKVVELREYFPAGMTERRRDLSLQPVYEHREVWQEGLRSFIDLCKNVSRLRELSVVSSLLDIFEAGGTAYAVYSYAPTVSLRRYVERSGGRLSWNEASRLFTPALSALGLINSLGMAHLGVSPDTLRVTREGGLLITGFCIGDIRRESGSPFRTEIFSGCAALEQYRGGGVCGEASDVYAFAACLLFALTGKLPDAATDRKRDQRLMISREVLKTLPPFAVTALANALQVSSENRTPSFERFRAELSSQATVVNEVDQTQAIRRLPAEDRDLPLHRGLPPIVWFIVTLAVMLVAMFFVANIWLGDRGMSFQDLGRIFDPPEEVQATETVPNLVNQDYDQWVERLNEGLYDFTLKISSRVFSETVGEGKIVSQDPLPDEKIPAGSMVTVTVSKGSATRSLPPFAGMNFAQVQTLLNENGFEAVQAQEASEDIDAGFVIRYEGHAPGDKLDYGSSVTVVVSTGPQDSGG